MTSEVNRGERLTPLKKGFSQKCDFSGTQAFPWPFWSSSPCKPYVSQLQNGISTSSLPPFIVDFWHLETTQDPNRFFNGNFRSVLNGKQRERLTVGRNSSERQKLWHFPLSVRLPSHYWQSFPFSIWIDTLNRAENMVFGPKTPFFGQTILMAGVTPSPNTNSCKCRFFSYFGTSPTGSTPVWTIP